MNIVNDTPSKAIRKRKKSKKCRNCLKSEPFRGYPEILCRPCIKLLPSDTCMYCRKEFHILSSAPREQKGICNKCYSNLEIYGEPSECRHCKQRSAFNGKQCARCTLYIRSYGKPIKCQECSVVAAFRKSMEQLNKVGNRFLCYTCTLQYKRAQKKMKKRRFSQQGKNGTAKKKKKKKCKNV